MGRGSRGVSTATTPSPACFSPEAGLANPQVELVSIMSDPGKDSNMQQLVLMAPSARVSGGELVAKASVGDSGKQLVLVEGGGKNSGGVKLREDEEDLEVKLRRIMENVPVRVSNTSGSSAGSGSGISTRLMHTITVSDWVGQKVVIIAVEVRDNNKLRHILSVMFVHQNSYLTSLFQYRQMRRREQDRITRMESDYERRKQVAEFNLRREERLKAAEERTAKKRLKRQKKKQRKKEKRSKPDGGGEEEPKSEVPNRVEESLDDDKGSDYEGDDKFKQCQ
ncbi:hypothetical protein ZWY2020_010558 [Hordeum vulgare]|nr:hypothetical protein ZWY2020_010558 [Hordeum vulgare]